MKIDLTYVIYQSIKIAYFIIYIYIYIERERERERASAHLRKCKKITHAIVWKEKDK